MVGTAVSLGVVLNVLLYEVIGLSAGGMVVPGYLALLWDQPARLVSTFILAVVTWALVTQVVRRWVLLYGRRRYAAMLLVGMVGTWLLDGLTGHLPWRATDLRAIGFIVPGLIANEMELQGVGATIVVTAGLAALVRLILLLAAAWVPL